MSKHTPGPWVVWDGNVKVYAGPVDENTTCCISGYRCKIAECDDLYDENMTEEEAEANARLIAAAPELLEALEWIVNPDYAIGSNAEYKHAAVEVAKAAIAKATGEPQ